MSSQPNLYENPFDRPLDSEVQEHQAALQATTKASDNGNPFDEPLLSEKAEAQAQQTGQVTNDVGEQVIVPKPGESFADTMKRGAAMGRQRIQNGTAQQAIDKEMATVPGKLPAVAGGVVGAASLPVIEGLAPEAVGAAKALLQAHPQAAKALGKMILSSALGGEVGHSAKSAIIGALLGGLI